VRHSPPESAPTDFRLEGRPHLIPAPPARMSIAMPPEKLPVSRVQGETENSSSAAVRDSWMHAVVA